MITYRQLVEAILLENSNFRGEYWIQDGYVQFADGDVGDLNHEAIVIQNAAGQVLSEIGIDADEPYLEDMKDEIYEAIQDGLPDEIREKYENIEITIQDCLKYYGKHVLHNAKFDELVDAAYDRIDVRRFAMREWGWKAIRGNVVDTWNITPKDLSQISSGLYEAYSHEIDTYDSEKLDEHGNKGPYFDMEVYSRGDYYSDVPWDLIGQDISKILPYRTFVKGQRITETGEKVGFVQLAQSPMAIKDTNLQYKLDAIGKKYQNHLKINALVYQSYIELVELMAKKTAPVGTGSSYMKELCKFADENNKMIVLMTSSKGYGGVITGNDYFSGFKTTTSNKRIKNFYKRFGFISNYDNNDYRPDLRGNMHRNPQK
jgi:hypothetical protein